MLKIERSPFKNMFVKLTLATKICFNLWIWFELD